MRTYIKKLGILCIMIMLLGTMAACGNEGTEESMKTGAEQALELEKEADDAVERVNEEVKNFDNFQKDLEME